MRSRSVAKKDSAARLTPRVRHKVPWRVTRVKALSGFRLLVRFVDGLEGEVDASGLILSKKAGVFATLADPRKFSEAYVELGAVTWPGELDLAPDTMYDEIKRNGAYKMRRG